MGQLAAVLAGAVGIWLGMHALRSFLATLAFNVAEDVPATLLAAIALAIWLIGLSGWLAARVVGRERAAVVVGGLFIGLTVGRQLVVDETVTALLAIGALIAWLWWLPAVIDLFVRRGVLYLLAPAVVLGLALQVGGQIALAGLDLHVLLGPLEALFAALLGAVLLAGLLAIQRLPTVEPSVGRWAGVALLPYVFLQLTLLANVGRVQALGGWDLPLAGLVILAGLAGAALGVWWLPSRSMLALLATITVTSIIVAASGGPASVAVIPTQFGLAVLLAAGLRATPAATAAPRTYAASTLGGLIFFALLFAVYYDFADSMGIVAWSLAGVIVALPTLRASLSAAPPQTALARRLPAAVGLIAVGSLGMTFVPPAAGGDQPRDLHTGAVVLDYNIHQGMGRNGVPSMPRILDVIRAADADIIALQEVNRVWNLGGGVDTYSGLRRQLPGYHAVFGPMHGVHFGNAIFSRDPIVEWGSERFPLGASGLPRGFVWAVIETAATDVLVVSAHLTAYDRGDEAAERAEQATHLLHFWTERGRPTAIFAGDYNSDRASPAVERTLAAGLTDALAVHGLAAEPTFVATGNLFNRASVDQLDYVFVTPDIDVLAATITQSDASDHFPLNVTVRIDNR